MRSGSPYRGQSEEHRDVARAEALHQQAVAAIESNPAKAESLFREALQADLYHGPAHNNLGALLLRRGELYAAAGEFEWAGKLLPGHPDPRMNLALTLELAGRTDDAIVTYLTALEVYPEHISTLQALTRLQVRVGNTDEHTEEYLVTISLRGTTAEWRRWARLQIARSGR